MPTRKPEKNTPEYAAYKEAKRAARRAERSDSQVNPGTSSRRRHRRSHRDDVGTFSVTDDDDDKEEVVADAGVDYSRFRSGRRSRSRPELAERKRSESNIVLQSYDYSGVGAANKNIDGFDGGGGHFSHSKSPARFVEDKPSPLHGSDRLGETGRGEGDGDARKHGSVSPVSPRGSPKMNMKGVGYSYLRHGEAAAPAPGASGLSYPLTTPGVGTGTGFLDYNNSTTGVFIPGQGKVALQSAVPSVFRFQTGGPSGFPHGGDSAPPPNLHPRNYDPRPGEGVGKIYPPGQTPPQFQNPDYYSLPNDTDASQSMSHAMITASGMPDASRAFRQSASYSGNSSRGGLPGKLGIPSLSSLSLSPGDSKPPTTDFLPPPSPALQPYYGTYQSISPLPSPVLPASSCFSPPFVGNHNALDTFSIGPPACPSPEHLPNKMQHHQSTSSISSIQDTRPSYPNNGNNSYSPFSLSTNSYSPSFHPTDSHIATITTSNSRSSSPAIAYNPTADAKAILEELCHTFTRPSPKPLIRILPTLTPEELKVLRSEYKSQYRGINLAKHIKSVFTTASPFGKVVFAVTLGPYESEAWFANSWYQKKQTRNELLIESLMGKSNKEIMAIKKAFKDAKYDALLEKAVSEELSANKFRIAVMAQLSCSRMEEDRPLVPDGIREDVTRLGTILERSSSGGETEMMGIIVNRSDLWLREVAALYRQVYERDLAKAIMKHSKNLVGETLLHILNGAVNKPLRDAKLLDQAITAVLEQDREDLLISRATRIHWDPQYLQQVKRVFKKKYRVEMGKRVREATRGSYMEFLLRMLRED